jgi:hypothetical protein
MSRIGQKIRNIRELKNYTQEHLAGKLEISQNAYSKMESGGSKISTERLQRIAEILETPIENILSEDQKVLNFNNYDNAVGYIEHLQNDNKEHTKMLHEQIRYLQSENQKLLQMVEKLTFK